ncbi:MAG: beta-aspartyl-peptidase [Halomonas sp.]|nr:beta-aspartyl-peptidase [Halomonas sp.]TVP51051.1 MAG: beta-aspartyl-peptidase [Halomonas sp.]
MLTLVKNVQLFTPEPRGLCHLLIAAHRIAAVIDATEAFHLGSLINTVDLEGRRVIPGLVDPLVHYIGGGGEGGFGNRTAELSLEEASASGVTTLVGALGTDAITRTPANLIGKARELAAGGLTTYAYTGSYQLPPVTLTGTVASDILYIPEFIGVGEVAISDHRGSQPSTHELTRLAADARTAGLLAGKSGIVFIHTGDADTHLEPLRSVAKQSAIPLKQFYPTHINRTPELFEDGLRFAREGGLIDFTTSSTPELLAGGEVPASEAVARALSAGIDPARISLSSDANASLPQFDEHHRFVGLKPGRLRSLFEVLGECINEHQINVESALRCAATSAANTLKLPHKGRLGTGSDADFIVLAEGSWAIDQVWALGKSIYAAP